MRLYLVKDAIVADTVDIDGRYGKILLECNLAIPPNSPPRFEGYLWWGNEGYDIASKSTLEEFLDAAEDKLWVEYRHVIRSTKTEVAANFSVILGLLERKTFGAGEEVKGKL